MNWRKKAQEKAQECAEDLVQTLGEPVLAAPIRAHFQVGNTEANTLICHSLIFGFYFEWNTPNHVSLYFHL